MWVTGNAATWGISPRPHLQRRDANESQYRQPSGNDTGLFDQFERADI